MSGESELPISDSGVSCRSQRYWARESGRSMCSDSYDEHMVRLGARTATDPAGSQMPKMQGMHGCPGLSFSTCANGRHVVDCFVPVCGSQEGLVNGCT